MTLDAETVVQRWQSQLVSVGMIVNQAAMLDRVLEQAFCALVGSKYAALVASGQNTSWLTEHCKVLADAHAELPESARQAIAEALKACSAAAGQRNSLVHSIVMGGGLDVVMAVKGARKSHKVTVTQWTLDEIRGVADKLIRAEHALAGAAESAFGSDWMRFWEQLRREDMERVPRAGQPARLAED